MSKTNFTEGKILGPLFKFALPILMAMCLQALYGAVDLLIVGQFAQAGDVSAVATGSQMLQMITVVITGLAMGTTILLGQAIGKGQKEEASNIVGSSIVFFAIVSAVLTIFMLVINRPFTVIMQAPPEAFNQTMSYVFICSLGITFIVAYNAVGSILRAIGDSKTPLYTVFMASVFNVGGDLFFVAVLHMGAAGAAIATVMAQALSVVLCLMFLRRKKLIFSLRKENISFQGHIIKRIFSLGFPVALQDALVGVSFLAINSIVNSLGVVASAGVGVAEKICAFVMLVPSSFSQSLSVFVAQNIGAGKRVRARKAMLCGMGMSLMAGVVMSYASLFYGSNLAGIFTANEDIVYAAADYLKAYSIDCLLVSFLFCFIGYFNGSGQTKAVMVQGILGAFCVRIPVSYYMSKLPHTSLFKIGLATPCSTIVQIILCSCSFWYLLKKEKKINNTISKGLTR